MHVILAPQRIEVKLTLYLGVPMGAFIHLYVLAAICIKKREKQSIIYFTLANRKLQLVYGWKKRQATRLHSPRLKSRHT